MQIIREFQGEHRFLSNFWPARITFGEWTFPTAEHAYQAAKSLDPVDWKDAQECVSPGAAKRLGKTFTLRPDWDDVKLEIMPEIVRAKFRDPELREKLLATGDAQLIEGNNWGDTFWGVSRGKGHNHLGRILMQVRSEILNQKE